MNEWSTFVSEVQKHLSALTDAGCDCPFFRGHSDPSWHLSCGLGRRSSEHFKKKSIESILYYDFMSQAGPLLARQNSSWDVLFSMQHHGLPTRLLDWSSTFAVALYFALKPYLALASPNKNAVDDPGPSACIWVLDPFELNKKTTGQAVVLNPETDLEGSYQEVFIEECKSLNATVMAVNPTQTGRRLAAQRGCFTLHSDVFAPLEQGAPHFLRKFVIPSQAIRDGVQFLQLAGMNEYSLFPDLDGLARHLKGQHVDWL